MERSTRLQARIGGRELRLKNESTAQLRLVWQSDKSKLPSRVKGLVRPSQLLLHISHTLEKCSGIPCCNNTAPVSLEDPTPKRSKAVGRLSGATNILKKLLQSNPPTTTQFRCSRKEDEASRVKQAVVGLSFPLLTRLGSSTGGAVAPNRVIGLKYGNRKISQIYINCIIAKRKGRCESEAGYTKRSGSIRIEQEEILMSGYCTLDGFVTVITWLLLGSSSGRARLVSKSWRGKGNIYSIHIYYIHTPWRYRRQRTSESERV